MLSNKSSIVKYQMSSKVLHTYTKYKNVNTYINNYTNTNCVTPKMLISGILNPNVLNSGIIKLELATVFILET